MQRWLSFAIKSESGSHVHTPSHELNVAVAGVSKFTNTSTLPSSQIGSLCECHATGVSEPLHFGDGFAYFVSQLLALGLPTEEDFIR